MDKVEFRAGWRKTKIHESCGWDCCAGGKLVLTSAESEALFAYIDELERKLVAVVTEAATNHLRANQPAWDYAYHQFNRVNGIK